MSIGKCISFPLSFVSDTFGIWPDQVLCISFESMRPSEFDQTKSSALGCQLLWTCRGNLNIKSVNEGYLQPNRREFPRKSACIDGVVLGLLRVSAGVSFAKHVFSLGRLFLPSLAEMVSGSCFENCQNLSHLAFECGSGMSVLPEAPFSDYLSLQSSCSFINWNNFQALFAV
jgi:hypothetical protein